MKYFLLCCVVAAPVAAQSTLERRVDAYFAAAVAGGDFSGSVLIARGDSVLVRKGYGLANVELRVAATPETRYLIASLTKTLTAGTIVRLRDQGRLRFEDTLVRYLPSFPHGPQILLAHLLGHASGVTNPDYDALFGRQVGLAELVDGIGRQPLQFAPGSDSRYSNAGYNLLAAVIERVTSRSYGEAVREAVLAPLGMTSTGDASDGGAVTGLATAYVAGPGPARGRAVAADVSANTGAGSVYSTVDDLFRWARALQTDRLFRLGSLAYPYGWGRRQLAGGRWLEQTGLLDGWASNLYVGLDTALVVIVLANHSTPSFGRWGRELAQLVMVSGGSSVEPLRAELPAQETFVDPVTYLGRYRSANFGVRVTTSGRALYLEVDDWPVARYLAPSGPDRFVVGDFGLELVFTRDAQGRVTEAAWGTGDGRTVFRPVAAARLGTAQSVGIDRVSWLGGCWLGVTSARVIEENWTVPRGRSMIGVSRTFRGDSLVEYELVVLRERDGRLAYEAHPSGQPVAEFPAREVTDSSVLFENPGHDYPQRIGYRRVGSDSLVAWIDGAVGGRARRVEFPYARTRCPGT